MAPAAARCLWMRRQRSSGHRLRGHAFVVGDACGHGLGIVQHLHRDQKPIACLGDGFDVGLAVVVVVAERLAQLGDGLGQHIVGRQRVRPYLGEQLVAGDNATRLPQQHAQHAQRLRRQPARATRADDLDFARGQSDGALSYPDPIGYRELDFAAVHFLLHSRDRSRAVFAFDTAPSWEQRKARLRTKHRRIPQNNRAREY